MAVMRGDKIPFDMSRYNSEYHYQCTYCGTKEYRGRDMKILTDPSGLTNFRYIFCSHCADRLKEEEKQLERQVREKNSFFKPDEHCHICFHEKGGLKIEGGYVDILANSRERDKPHHLCFTHYAERSATEGWKEFERQIMSRAHKTEVKAFRPHEHCYICHQEDDRITGGDYHDIPADGKDRLNPHMLCSRHYLLRTETQEWKDYFKPKTSIPQSSVVTEIDDFEAAPVKVSTTIIKSNKTTEEGKFNMNFSKLFGGAQIGKVQGDQFKLSMMGLAVKVGNGEYACYDGHAMVNVMDFIMDAEGMIYQFPVQSVEQGDLIIVKGKPVYVIGFHTNGSIEIFDPATDLQEVYIPQKNLFGFNFFIKVISMFNMFQQPDQPQNPMAQMLPFMMMGEGKGEKDPMQMMAMMMFMNPQAQAQGQNNPMAQMLPFMMMGEGKGEKNDMMKMMAMSMFMGQGQGFQFPFMQQPAPATPKKSTSRRNNNQQTPQATGNEAQ